MHVAAGHLTPPSPPLSPCHLAPPSSPLLVNCPPCFSLSPLPILCHPLAPQFSPQTTPLPLILPLLASVFQPPWNPLILLNLCFPQKISPLTLFLPIFVPPGPLPPQRWWDLGGTRCLAWFIWNLRLSLFQNFFKGLLAACLILHPTITALAIPPMPFHFAQNHTNAVVSFDSRIKNVHAESHWVIRWDCTRVFPPQIPPRQKLSCCSWQIEFYNNEVESVKIRSSFGIN